MVLLRGIVKSCTTLSTLRLGNYGMLVCYGHAVSTVFTPSETKQAFETLSSKASTLNPKPSALRKGRKKNTPNLKPQARNPESRALNPKPRPKSCLLLSASAEGALSSSADHAAGGEAAPPPIGVCGAGFGEFGV